MPTASPLHEEKYPGEIVRVPDSAFEKPLGWKRAERLSARYGVSSRELRRESLEREGRRLFRLFHLVPFVISAQELLHGDIDQIAAERRLDRTRLLRARRWTKGNAVRKAKENCLLQSQRGSFRCSTTKTPYADGSRASREDCSGDDEELGDSDGTTAATTAASSPASSTSGFDVAAVAAMMTEGGTASGAPLSSLSFLLSHTSEVKHPVPSLRLLASVADEEFSRSGVPTAAGETHKANGIHPALMGRLGKLPLPVLREVATTLAQVADTLEARISTQEDAVAEAVATYIHEQHNAFLYNVCLWQRRHPLAIVAFVLEMYRTGQIAEYAMHRGQQNEVKAGDDDDHWPVPEGFSMPTSPVPMMDRMLEYLTASVYPGLAAVPHFIRCDVLMSYPLLPFDEQMIIMLDTNEHVKREQQRGQKVAPHSAQAEEGSAKPLCPRALLHGYLPDGAIPDRSVVGLTDAQYRTIRRAVEQHKKDGVRRLCNSDYH